MTIVARWFGTRGEGTKERGARGEERGDEGDRGRDDCR